MSALTIGRHARTAFGEVLAGQRRERGEVALEELKALRDVDFIAPPEAAALAESLVAAYRARPSSGDQLRLPQRTHADGPAVRAAIARTLSADVSQASADESAVIKEERMLRALRAVSGAIETIRQQSKLTV